jgi:hypothetical protein
MCANFIARPELIAAQTSPNRLYPKGHNKSEIAPYALFEFCRRFLF